MTRESAVRANVVRFTAVLALGVCIHIACTADRREGRSGLDIPERPARLQAIAFSHRDHLDMELGCQDCHRKGALVSVPSKDGGAISCRECHEEEIGDGKNETPACKSCHTTEEFDTPWPQGGRLEGLVFDHGRHVKVACETCHPGYAQRVGLEPGTPGDMRTCTECHDREKPLGCADCHRNLPALKPLSHDARNWLSAHGPMGRKTDLIRGTYDDCSACHQGDLCSDCHKERKPRSHVLGWESRPHGLAAGADRDRCAVCHERAACEQCHALSPPSDHDAHFRQVGHGTIVSVDRERCRRCHTADYCIRCHAEVSPRSHTVGWNNPQNRHCLNCHWPPGSNDENCTLCHRSFPGHDSQPPLSAAHASRPSDCSLCHTGMHPVGEDDCRECHH